MELRLLSPSCQPFLHPLPFAPRTHQSHICTQQKPRVIKADRIFWSRFLGLVLQIPKHLVLSRTSQSSDNLQPVCAKVYCDVLDSKLIKMLKCFQDLRCHWNSINIYQAPSMCYYTSKADTTTSTIQMSDKASYTKLFPPFPQGVVENNIITLWSQVCSFPHEHGAPSEPL